MLFLLVGPWSKLMAAVRLLSVAVVGQKQKLITVRFVVAREQPARQVGCGPHRPPS
jgi:hypothetical protein